MATSTEEVKYDVLDKIGHGSFGIIRKIKRKSDGKASIPSPAKINGPDESEQVMCRKEISYVKMSQKEREQLNAEMSILGSLRHPNIVAYYHRDHLKPLQELHLYMEYCGGGDLSKYIKNLIATKQNAPEEFVWMVFSQLVTALYRCHYGKDAPPVGSNVMASPPIENEGLRRKTDVMILHRDLKPDNIFLDEDNSVKLGDFGLSKLMQSHDYASTYVGTPYYMSPEICAAERYTLQSDVWSLGCIVYELCTKRPPFDARSHFELIGKIKAGRFEPLGPHYSRELADVVTRCLQTNPSRRPVTKQLVHMPVVRMCRKEREMVELGRHMRVKEADMAQKIAEAQALHVNLQRDVERARADLREEIEATVRREWEVRARLEIDRQVAEKVQQEIQRLKGLFIAEVGAAVEVEVTKRVQDLQSVPEAQPSSSISSEPSPSLDSPTTNLTSLSFDSPLASSTRMQKRSTRTPFSRARTQIDAPSPMDVQMASPSPRSIASLSLSPRRAAALARGLPQGNLFGAHAAAQAGKPSTALPSVAEHAAPEWQPQRQASPVHDADSEDEVDSPSGPHPLPEDLSPTRPPRHATSKNPFMALPPTRPGLRRQSTAPVARPALSAMQQPSLFTRVDRPAFNVGNVTSPGRMAGGARAGAGLAKAMTTGGDDMLKAVTQKNMLGGHGTGRTLVQLQQARAAETQLGVKEVPLWDPEDADAPSPFVKRTRAPLVR